MIARLRSREMIQIPGRAICPKFSARTDERSAVNPNEQLLSDEP